MTDTDITSVCFASAAWGFAFGVWTCVMLVLPRRKIDVPPTPVQKDATAHDALLNAWKDVEILPTKDVKPRCPTCNQQGYNTFGHGWTCYNFGCRDYRVTFCGRD